MPAAIPKMHISTPQPDAAINTQCHIELLDRKAVMYHQCGMAPHQASNLPRNVVVRYTAPKETGMRSRDRWKDS